MKKGKLILIMVITIIVLAFSTIAVRAIMKNETTMSKLTKVSENTLEEVYEIDYNINSKEFDKISDDAIKFLTNLNKNYKLSSDKFQIEFVKDNILNEEYYVVKSNETLLHILKDGTITTYLNTSPILTYRDYINNIKYNEKAKLDLEEKAKKIFSETNLVNNNQNYYFNRIVEKEEYFPTAWFKNEIDNRELFFTFNPENLEILNMGNKKIILSQNNEVKVSEETAKKIAIEQLSRSDIDIENIELSEVIPNEFFMPIENEVFYTMFNYKRNAFVVTFNDEYSTQVYVDATTGEVIGGNGLW